LEFEVWGLKFFWILKFLIRRAPERPKLRIAFAVGWVNSPCMRVRNWIMALAGLNLVLAAGWFNTWMQIVPPVPTSTRSNYSPPRAGKTKSYVRRSNFIWTEMESTNYFTFINNLRLIACPEPTIRNLVLAEINQLYIRRRNNEVLLPEQQWWLSTPDLEIARASVEKIKTLEGERKALLTKLLGKGWESSSIAQLPPIQSPLLTKLLGPGWETAVSIVSPVSASGISLTGPVLGNLSGETKQMVYEIAARARQKLESYRQAQKLQNQPVDPAEVGRLEQEERNELSSVLTPTQYQEFLLRYSQSAQQIREQMAGLNLSADQFRGLFQSLDPIVSQPAYAYNGDDPDLLREQQQLQAQTEAALKQTLGDDAYAAYKLNEDPVYLASKATAQQIGIPDESVMPLYQINLATQAEMDRIRSDTTLSDEDKMEALATTQVQQQQTVEKLVGPNAFQRWLQAQSQTQQLQTPASSQSAGTAPP
jgi:hypothetical protein